MTDGGRVEIRLRGKYRNRPQAKQTGKGKSAGHGAQAAVTSSSGKLLPVGIRKHPRRRYGS